MAVSVFARPRGLGAWVREWRPGRVFPLYVAALLAGAGLGIGFDVLASDAGRIAPRAVVERAEQAPALDVGLVWPGLLREDLGVSLDGGAPVAAVGRASDPGPGTLPADFARALGMFGPWMPPASGEDPAGEGSAQAEQLALQRPVAVPASRPVDAVAPVQPPATAAQPAGSSVPAKLNFYVPQVSAGPATALELELFERINAERAKVGLAPYVLDAGLTKVARTRSQQLIDQGYFGHVDPYGYSMYVELLAYFGFGSYAWAGENLAMNNYPAGQAVGVALEGLMNSPTHRANLLAGDFSRIGVGEVTDGEGRHYFTMIFLG